MYNEFSNAKLLFEGAQSVLLSLNGGTYPYVTSCDTTIAGIYNSGFNFIKLNNVIGVTKAYCTRVGNGPFPSELSGEYAEELRRIGNEYGATTGRPRRVGWLDIPMLRYSTRRGGATSIAITKLDILNGLKNIPYIEKYNKEPVIGDDFNNPNVFFNTFPGWSCAKTDITNKDSNVYNFIKKIEQYIMCNVSYVSVGTDSESLIKLV
jgi:adenylosuccinate synthase